MGDTDNVSGEPGGASILLSQDGGAIAGRIGIVQGANQDGAGGTYTGTLNNAMYIGSVNNVALQLGTNRNIRMTVTNGGNVGIGLTNPSQRLHVSGNILATGNITAFSDARIKANVEQIEGALGRVQQIRGVTYTRTDLDDKERRYGGVIAQEIEAVLPEAIFDSSGTKSVDYNATIALLIEAVKELKAEVEELKGSKS